jgi:hypothetical protein
MNKTDTNQEFEYISEEEYKTLLSVYQKKTFDLFNKNIGLEAKNTTLTALVKKLTEKLEDLQESSVKTSSRRKTKTNNNSTETENDVDSLDNQESFN